MKVNMHMCGDQKPTADAIVQKPGTLFLRQHFSMTNYARLADQEVPGVLLSPFFFYHLVGFLGTGHHTISIPLRTPQSEDQTHFAVLSRYSQLSDLPHTQTDHLFNKIFIKWEFIFTTKSTLLKQQKGTLVQYRMKQYSDLKRKKEMPSFVTTSLHINVGGIVAMKLSRNSKTNAG